MTASIITRVGTVLVTVTDQDRALDFYVNTLGCTVVLDGKSPAGRWIEVAPPAGETTIAIVQPQSDGAVLSLATADAEAAHATLVAAGVETSEFIPGEYGMPSMFSFRDPDGSVVRVVER